MLAIRCDIRRSHQRDGPHPEQKKINNTLPWMHTNRLVQEKVGWGKFTSSWTAKNGAVWRCNWWSSHPHPWVGPGGGGGVRKKRAPYPLLLLSPLPYTNINIVVTTSPSPLIRSVGWVAAKYFLMDLAPSLAASWIRPCPNQSDRHQALSYNERWLIRINSKLTLAYS